MQLALTEPQEDFVFCKGHRPAMIGGLGSGKTKAGTSRTLLQLLGGVGHHQAYYMPSYDLLNLRAIPAFVQDLTELGLSFTINKSEYKIDVAGYGYIIFRSYNNPERIVAYEVADSIIDELDTISRDKARIVWRKINERNRLKIGRRNTIGCVTTPDQGYNGFIYEKWFKEPQDGYEVITAPTYSNPFLPDNYTDDIRANYDPILADAYIEGKIVNFSGDNVYHFFDRLKHHTDRELTPKDKDICVSIDFNVGGCCATVSVIDGKWPVVVDEFVSKNTYDFIDNLKIRYPDKRITVYPDASGDSDSTNASKSDIQLIKQAGFKINAPKSNPLIRNRVNSVNKLLAHEQVMINTKTCPELTYALETQGYDEKTQQPEKFSEHPAIDDWADSFGYFINKRYPINKPATSIDVSFPI